MVVVLVVVALVVARLLERRRPDVPTQPQWSVPSQLDRSDFARPDAPWLVALFTSATCTSCAKARRDAAVLASEEVAVQEVELATDADLHRRYAIDAVPTIVVADRDGVVRASFLGPPTATDLWGAVAEVRQPGSTPEPHLGQPGARTSQPGST